MSEEVVELFIFKKMIQKKPVVSLVLFFLVFGLTLVLSLYLRNYFPVLVLEIFPGWMYFGVFAVMGGMLYFTLIHFLGEMLVLENLNDELEKRDIYVFKDKKDWEY